MKKEKKEEKKGEKMTVAQLIKKLEKFPPKMGVVTMGYEGGYHDVEDLEILKLKRNVNSEWYYGPHEKDDEGEEYVLV